MAETKKSGVPTCNGGGKQVELNHNELFSDTLFCHECCSTFPVVITGKTQDGFGRLMTIPFHRITPELHAIRSEQSK